MDILGYTYDAGNKLVKVTDTANNIYGFKDGANLTTEYTYDVNGNLKTDANKNITAIQYNYLNLPTQVSFGATKNISYIYDATGTKLKKVVNDNGMITTTSYAGNYVYENDALQFFNQPEGYVEPVSAGSTNFAYVYQYKDHLGNVRLSYSDSNGDGVITPTGLGAEIREENNYYPFGLKHKGYNNLQNGRDHKFGFGNKEEQDELGLSWIDITARNYDPALGRWMNVDPLADNTHNFEYSPYNYVKNNPKVFIDPNGEDWFYYKKEGKKEASWNWQEGNSYKHKYSYTDADGKKQNKTIELKGVEAVIVFEGSSDEKLGDGNSLFGKGANLAKVTVYGPEGAKDIKTYDGFSMGSDSKKFGAIADGTYDFNYDANGKSGKLKSHWAVENRGTVPALDGYNPNPNATTDRRFKNGIFIHTSNQSGFAGAYNKGKNGISEGCLLIVPTLYTKQGTPSNNGWNQFNEQLKDVKKGVIQVIRK